MSENADLGVDVKNDIHIESSRLKMRKKQPATDCSMYQCKFFLKKKQRLCRFKAKPGQEYCPEHACIMGVQGERRRIPCPLNPKHNCYEDELEKHIKRCNVTRIQEKLSQEVYFVKGVNVGTKNSSDTESSKNQTCVKDLTSEELRKMIDKVKKLYSDYVEPIQQEHFQHPCVQKELDSSSSQQDLSFILKNQAALHKELMQQAALIGQMEMEKLLENENTCFIELGAGKGKLSHWINKASRPKAKNKYLLIERGSVRYKMDGYLKQAQGETHFQRIKMDIEDLYLGKVPELDPQDTFVIVGKHLCGGATDMGIRCATNTLVFEDQSMVSKTEPLPSRQGPRDTSSEDIISQLPDSTTEQQHNKSHASLTELISLTSSSSEEERDLSKCDQYEGPPIKAMKTEKSSNFSSQDKMLPKGIMIALCCHHRCTWDTYTGKSFMEECGVSPDEFDLLTRLSSWATCARVRVQAKTNPRKNEPSGSQQLETSINNSDAQGKALEESTEEHESEDLVTLTKNSNLREQLSISEREKIGRLCKRLIDTGRLHHLRSKGMTAFLREYVNEEITPENIVLIAQS